MAAAVCVEHLLEDLAVGWLCLEACDVVVVQDVMPWVDVVTFDVVVHRILVEYGEGKRIQSNLDHWVVAVLVEIKQLLGYLFV